MELTKKNRALLRSRAAKRRGNPIFVSSQPIPKSGRVPIITPEPEPLARVNEVIAPEQNYSSIDLTALTNKQSNTPRTPGGTLSALSELGTYSLQFKRQRTNEEILHDEYDEQESFVASLPLFAIEKRLDFGLNCDDSKCYPHTMAITGEIYPKKISLSVANPSSDCGGERYGGISISKTFDATFNNKWGISRETTPEVENSSSGVRTCEDDETTSEESSENQLRVEENDNDERREREKRACKSVFNLVRLMELRRVGLAKPPKNPVNHVQLVKEIRKCTANLRNKPFTNYDNTVQTPPVFKTSPVVNLAAIAVEDSEPTLIEDSCSTVECNEEATSVDTILEEVDNTSLVRKDNSNDASYERPILKRRVKQPNSWQDISEKLKNDRERVSFKDRLNPIAAAEYDKMDVIELDIYDELPNQFRSDVPKEFTRRWPAQDTEEFYKCIALLGLDFGRIATVMCRTQKQITNKFKLEQKKNNKRLHNALIRQGEFFEYRKKYRF
ncbi:hypothetical protein RclHR1_02240010 [Rhizophagus clarus]|uniref:Myb-like domain-containing protein n=1 Tax=Rhizophagus clarus TaxID=94130 RepID=A0A2Z6RNY0_9GLOM|nr:hypothetical protein RclHR1_02240010 [Rhizophagus clarus]GES90392.1 hypothetical protein GLOIN_2v1478425 [Rhizophagus clarus]